MTYTERLLGSPTEHHDHVRVRSTVKALRATERTPDPTVRVLERTDDELVPIPTDDQRHGVGHYQHLVLDLDTHRLYFHTEDWNRAPGERVDDRDRPIMFPPVDYAVVGRRISWLIDSGSAYTIPEQPWLNARQGNDLAQQAVLDAQVLADNLVAVPGRDVYDWSAAAVRAGLRIHALVQRNHALPDDVDLTSRIRDIHEMQVVGFDPMTRLGRLFRDGIADADDEQIEEAAKTFTRGVATNTLLDREYPGLVGMWNWGRIAGSGGPYRRTIVGIRAFLHGARLEALGGLVPVDAQEWLIDHGHTVRLDVSSVRDMFDDELRAWAEAVAGRAREQGVHLVGVTDCAARLRDTLREEFRSAVADGSAEILELRSRLDGLVRRRNSGIHTITTWGVKTDTDEALGSRFGVSHTIINRVRNSGAPEPAELGLDEPAPAPGQRPASEGGHTDRSEDVG